MGAIFTVETFRALLDRGITATDAWIDLTIDTVEADLDALYDVPLDEITGEVPADVRYAVALEVNHALTRKDSPNGVEGFGGDGALRSSRFEDPDAARRLAKYLRSAVA